MPKSIIVRSLTRQAFQPYGDVIEKQGAEQKPINNGKCIRHHDLAKIEVSGPAGAPSINIFCGKPYELPLELTMVERHPLGSQAFIPMHDRPFLVIVCPDENGKPGEPVAFITAPGQGINFRKNQWHGVLTPLGEEGDFAVIDRVGDGNNLEEYYFPEPYWVMLP